MTEPAGQAMPDRQDFPGAVLSARIPGASPWLRAVLPGPGGPRGPRDPLLHEDAASLWRAVHEALSGLALETVVFVRRGGSLKVVPRHLAGTDDTVALQLARIANALRGAGFSTWWTDSGITAGPGPASPVPPPGMARQFLAGRIGDGTPVTSEMIEIAQAVLPGAGDPAPQEPQGRASGPRRPPGTRRRTGR
jgi:hypothetical protein